MFSARSGVSVIRLTMRLTGEGSQDGAMKSLGAIDGQFQLVFFHQHIMILVFFHRINTTRKDQLVLYWLRYLSCAHITYCIMTYVYIYIYMIFWDFQF